LNFDLLFSHDFLVIVEKPPRNSAGFCGGSQGLSWAVEPRKEERKKDFIVNFKLQFCPAFW
jgi:hypothetical protein